MKNEHGSSPTKTCIKKQNIIIITDACLKFYNSTKRLFLETDAACTGLRAGLLLFSKDANTDVAIMSLSMVKR